jgi:hypothetical protein
MAELIYPSLSYRIVGILLKKSRLELGLLARFGTDGVKVKRILKGY